MLILSITEDLDKLFEDGGLTAIASLCKLSRVVEMAVDLGIVFVVTVLGAKDSRAYRAGEMFDVVLPIQGGDV